MPPLWKLARDPRCWLVIIAVILALIILDAARAPSEQITVKIYVAGISAYQALCRPVIVRLIHCRYRPTCSQYCIAAARKHGLGRGLLLSIRRVLSCKKSVPEGTFDPIPD